MNLEKLNPWNWFKHEGQDAENGSQVPVSREEAGDLTYRGGANSLLKLHREMDQLFDDVFSAFGMPAFKHLSPNPQSPQAVKAYHPQIDVSGDEKNYEIALDVPGLNQSDLTVEVKGDVLVIRGEKEEKHESKDRHFYRLERSFGSFQRTLSLPDDANADDIQATLKDGVLRLSIPRQPVEQKNVRKIAISA